MLITQLYPLVFGRVLKQKTWGEAVVDEMVLVTIVHIQVTELSTESVNIWRLRTIFVILVQVRGHLSETLQID